MTPNAPDDAEPWIIPLHGIEAPGEVRQAPPTALVSDDAPPSHLYADDELPTLEFRPRLRRTA